MLFTNAFTALVCVFKVSRFERTIIRTLKTRHSAVNVTIQIYHGIFYDK